MLLAWIYAGLPFAGIDIFALGAVAIGFFLTTSSYYGEIFRAGIESIPRGQMEAARRMGLTKAEAIP
jgi:polar amino acid transport system permease protein